MTNTEVKSEHTWSSSLLSLIRSPNIPKEMTLVMRPDAVWLNPPPLKAYPLQEGMDQGHMMQRPKFKVHRQPASNGILDSQWHLHPAQSYSRAKDLGKGAIGYHISLVCRITPVMGQQDSHSQTLSKTPGKKGGGSLVCVYRTEGLGTRLDLHVVVSK